MGRRVHHRHPRVHTRVGQIIPLLSSLRPTRRSLAVPDPLVLRRLLLRHRCLPKTSH
jgi:hypothetical protein